MKENGFYEQVHSYTKFKLVEMLIEKHQDRFEDIDTIEDVTEDILKILALSGLKFYGHMKKENG